MSSLLKTSFGNNYSERFGIKKYVLGDFIFTLCQEYESYTKRYLVIIVITILSDL